MKARYLAFLRAINVGGRNVPMEKLRGLFEELGFTKVETLIASGNVIFETKAASRAVLQGKIESHLLEELGYDVATFVRTDAEIAEIVRYHPFDERSLAAATAFNVAFLARPMSEALARKIPNFKTEIDDFHVCGSEVYWLCRKKQSESTFSNSVFERALGIRATFRGMKTIEKLAAKYPAETTRKLRSA